MVAIVPTVALTIVIAVLVWNDLQTLRSLRDYEASAVAVTELVSERTAIQRDRTATVDPAEHNERIAERTAEIDDRLLESPAGTIDIRSDALGALLVGQEALRLENLEMRVARPDAVRVTRLHAVQTDAFARFANGGSAEGRMQLEGATLEPMWRTASLVRSRWLDDPTASVDDAWHVSAAARTTRIDALARDESDRLVESTRALAQAEINRLTALAGIVVGVLLLGIVGSLAIRRSIVQPLRVLSRAATRLSKGELAPIDDQANDEIGRVARAFSSLADTMHTLWTDIDAIETSVRQTEFDRRIGSDDFEGDWLRLVETMNATLDTGAEHARSVQSELARRDVLTEISGSAVLATDAAELTEMVLATLPRVEPGSIAQIHQHPIGPPLFDLGVKLQPAISALDVPTAAQQAVGLELDGQPAVASLVDFGTGAPAVLVLILREDDPESLEPLISLVETAARVLAQAHRRQAAEWSATHNFEHDALTGLLNASGLDRWVAEREGDRASMAMIGVQPLRLDVLDSTWGRGARDAVVTIFSRRLRRVVRDRDVIARLDDPEFVIVTPTSDSESLVDRLVAAFRHPLSIGDELVAIDLTIGVADWDDDLEQVVTNVSTAIRQSDGRTTDVIRFEQEHRDAAIHRSELERWLEGAIDNNELTVHFQPIVDAVTTLPVGYECLVRGSQNGTPISPGEFIPIAEETGLISAIGSFTLRESCAALPFLPGESPYVSVNLSPIELAYPDVIERLTSVLDESGVDRSRIVFEVTEGATTDKAAVEKLHEIRELGVSIAIDDFGTGQSNLSYLTSLPAQILKLDRALVTPMVEDEASRSVAQAAVALAHEIGMTVVGEGVETNEELNALRRVRCDRIQGWLTGRPAPLADLIEVAESSNDAALREVGS
ncbi:MAG: EAL domain-containing protein [Acidimicrobiales bacterium]